MDEGFTHIGAQEIWGENNSLALSQTDRRQHVYMVGKTGTGKTTLLRNMIVQDIEAGRGVGVIDPHGELAEEILDHIVGDWGDVDEHDRAQNERALQEGTRLLSVYRSTGGVKFWIITEADRSVTTVLLPEDY